MADRIERARREAAHRGEVDILRAELDAAREVASELVGQMADLRAERDACVADERKAHCDTVVRDGAMLDRADAVVEAAKKLPRCECRAVDGMAVQCRVCAMTDREWHDTMHPIVRAIVAALAKYEEG